MKLIFDDGTEIEVDVATSIDYSWEQDVTEFPVERGLPVNDSVRRRPRAVSARVIVSSVSSVGTPGTLTRSPWRPIDVLDRLTTAYDRGEKFAVITRLELIDNCVFRSIRMVDDEDSTRDFRIDITVQQLTIAISRSIQIPIKRRSTGQRSKAARKPAKPVTKRAVPEVAEDQIDDIADAFIAAKNNSIANAFAAAAGG